MKINEIMSPKISKVMGNNVEIDQGDGTKLTVDIKKKPLVKDPKTGKVKMPTKTVPGQKPEGGIKAGEVEMS